MLSVTFHIKLAECHILYIVTECQILYMLAECHILNMDLLNVIRCSVIMLSVAAPSEWGTIRCSTQMKLAATNTPLFPKNVSFRRNDY